MHFSHALSVLSMSKRESSILCQQQILHILSFSVKTSFQTLTLQLSNAWIQTSRFSSGFSFVAQVHPGIHQFTINCNSAISHDVKLVINQALDVQYHHVWSIKARKNHFHQLSFIIHFLLLVLNGNMHEGEQQLVPGEKLWSRSSLLWRKAECGLQERYAWGRDGKLLRFN